MLTPGSYKYICRATQDIPSGAYARLRAEIGQAIGYPVTQLFPEFAKAFPCTATAMDMHWPTPVLACDQWRGDWLVTLVMERPDLNLFFDLTIASEPMRGSEFDESHRMLPSKWVELYRWFWSFVITDLSVRPLSWRNTPFSWAARLSCEEYREQSGAKKSAVKDFEKFVGVSQEQLYCWLWSEAGDALFLNESDCDHKVYHVRNDDLGDVMLLSDAEGTLDRYLAHLVSGGAPSEFDFRE